MTNSTTGSSDNSESSNNGNCSNGDDGLNYPEFIRAIQLDVAGYQIAALRTAQQCARPADKQAKKTVTPEHSGATPTRILCVHGWLDNAASFVPLMGALRDSELDLDMVAIDLPGHGHSSSLDKAGSYNLADTALLLPQIMQALGWSNCHLLGHSLGGNLSVIAATAAPEQLQSLILLESLGPLSEQAEELPKRLKKAFAHRRDADRFASRKFRHLDEGVASRLAAARMSEAAARLIIERQMKHVTSQHEGHFEWRFDPRYRQATPVYLTEPQVHAILTAIECKVLVVIAEEGYLASRQETARRLQCLARPSIHRVPGNHHMHMDDPQPTASVLLDYFRSNG